MTNFYEALKVHLNSSSEEIKSAYRRCARETHPDRQGDVERFRKIQEAYAVLSDPQKRAAYDQERRAWMHRIGAIACQECGNANRITHRPTSNEIVRCAHCKTLLRATLSALIEAQRQALVRDTAQFVEEVGVDLVDLAADAVRTSIGRLRRRLGLKRNER